MIQSSTLCSCAMYFFSNNNILSFSDLFVWCFESLNLMSRIKQLDLIIDYYFFLDIYQGHMLYANVNVVFDMGYD